MDTDGAAAVKFNPGGKFHATLDGFLFPHLKYGKCK